uniref:NmrA-like family domain-containing protein 1 n=1 Tax=Geotrypetes seraphini TaxID=260995 RepID=A0A6P8P8N9_GEOSA|nr:nmrA-like family domain-containing protein 1 [Geotrypetes seraphini]XP_033771331.1 nmrA-like family domain-containing protein 1 [Geotrypetes seraphini]XP_033771332.1 nmrA-like family domain-containing protein 1 [Geotrypetes seraphini]XP_033771333.1 nmrA-like family domain-containing protein 1 [Geotrypetes seraphini]
MLQETVVVTEADSREGRSVATALLQDGGFKVTAALRDLSGQDAVQLQKAGADTIPQRSLSSLETALSVAQKCVVITTTDFQDPDPLKSEIWHGYRLADACKKQKVGHVIFLGQHHVHRKYGFPARHMDAKASINDYMTEIALPKTEIIAPFYFENFLGTFKPIAAGHDVYKLALPMGDTALDGISLAQIGPVVASVLRNPRRWIGKSCILSADRMHIHEYAATLSQLLHPKQFQDARVSVRSFVESYRGPGAQDLGNMFEFWKKGSQRMNRAVTSELCPGLQTFHMWASENKDQLRRALEDA